MKKKTILLTVIYSAIILGLVVIARDGVEKKPPTAAAEEQSCTVKHAAMMTGEIRRVTKDDVISVEKPVNPIVVEEIDLKGLTKRQQEVLNLARHVGIEYDLEKTMMGIVMQESIAGVLPSVGHMTADFGKRSYGVSQVKVAAARDVLKRHPELGKFRTDEELIGRLIYDDEFNIRIGALYFKHLRETYGFTWREALTAYNLGPGGARKVKNPEQYKYTLKVIGHIHSPKLKQFFPSGA